MALNLGSRPSHRRKSLETALFLQIHLRSTSGFCRADTDVVSIAASHRAIRSYLCKPCVCHARTNRSWVQNSTQGQKSSSPPLAALITLQTVLNFRKPTVHIVSKEPHNAMRRANVSHVSIHFIILYAGERESYSLLLGPISVHSSTQERALYPSTDAVEIGSFTKDQESFLQARYSIWIWSRSQSSSSRRYLNVTAPNSTLLAR